MARPSSSKGRAAKKKTSQKEEVVLTSEDDLMEVESTEGEEINGNDRKSKKKERSDEKQKDSLQTNGADGTSENEETTDNDSSDDESESEDEDSQASSSEMDEEDNVSIDVILAKRLRSKYKTSLDRKDRKPKSSKHPQYVEAIARRREDDIEEEDDPRKMEFLVKYKHTSYLDVEWLTLREIESIPTGKSKYGKWVAQGEKETLDYDEYYFNPEYLYVDRIIASRVDSNGEQFLVKWRVLNYDDCTWERKKDLLRKVLNVDVAIDTFRKFNSKETYSAALKTPKRPSPQPISDTTLASPLFNGNTLKDYQVDGVKWLIHSYYHKNNTILADEMGLGKTIQTVAMLHYLHIQHDIRGPFLIVAPMSTINQWKRELETWTSFNSIVFQGPVDAREVIHDWEWLFTHQKKKHPKVHKFQVMVITYEVALIESRRLSPIQWKYVVVDEGHRIKNKNSKLFLTLSRLKTDHKLILTGTPLQNGVQELWTLMNFLEPTKFSNCDEFMDEFGDLQQSEQVQRLHETLGKYLLRRVKEDVEPSIPQKEETLIELELTVLQKQYYRAILEGNREFLLRGAAKTSLLNLFMQLRKVCNHPFLLKGVEDYLTAGIKQSEDSENDAEQLALLLSSSSKFVFLDKLLARLRQRGSRVLIFSQMVRLLDLLEDYLNYIDYPYERLDGGDRSIERQMAIDRFSNPDIDRFVFLLSTKAGGLGINLTIADTVILFDSDWNPQNDLQAQARAHRIGQVKPVQVYRLITKNTYEKYMFEIASKKLGLDKVVLGNMDNGLEDRLSKEEIERLLKHGAYDLFKNDGAEKDPEFDFDTIMSEAPVVKYDVPDKGLSSFSTAKFVASEEDVVDINDADFWDKVLPTFRTANRLIQVVREDGLADPEKRATFLKDAETLANEASAAANATAQGSQGGYDPSENLILILREVRNKSVWTPSEKEQIETWIQILEKPRLRKRKARSDFVEVDEFFIKKDKKAKTAKKVKPAYNYYFKEKYYDVKKNNPDLNPVDAQRKVAEMWRKLPETAKKKYRDMAMGEHEQEDPDYFIQDDKDEDVETPPSSPEMSFQEKESFVPRTQPLHTFTTTFRSTPTSQTAAAAPATPINQNVPSLTHPVGLGSVGMGNIGLGAGLPVGFSGLPPIHFNNIPMGMGMQLPGIGSLGDIPNMNQPGGSHIMEEAMKLVQGIKWMEGRMRQEGNTPGGFPQPPSSLPPNLANPPNLTNLPSMNPNQQYLQGMGMGMLNRGPLPSVEELKRQAMDAGMRIVEPTGDKTTPQFKWRDQSGKAEVRVSPGQPEKKKGVSKKRDPYRFFFKDQYPKVKKENPDWEPKEVQRKVASMWKETPLEEKEKWRTVANNAEIKEDKKKSNQPDKPRDPYHIFMREKYNPIRSKYNLTPQDTTKKVAAMWRATPQDEREVYRAIARKEFEEAKRGTTSLKWHPTGVDGSTKK